MVEAYPLTWPNGWKRSAYRERARFGEHSIAYGANILYDELRKLGAKEPILSSNLKVKLDGSPMSSQRVPSDPGVAVYFKFNGKDQCMPCDKWDKVEHNIWAIAKSIEAMRGLERWGSKDIVDTAFRGFQALPDYTQKIRHFDDCVNKEDAKQRHRDILKKLHPDVGGNQEDFVEMERQYQEIMSRG